MGGWALVAVFLGFIKFGQPGTSVMPVLRIDQAPRLAAMGGAGIGAVDGATATYCNPAGLGRLVGSRYAIAHDQWFAGIKDEIAHAALRAGPGAFGLGLAYSGEPGIESWNADNMPGDTFSTWDGVVSAGYGLAVARSCQIGAAAKGFYQNLYTSGGWGGAVDVGFACRPLAFLGLGAVVRNVGVATYGAGLERTPIEAGIGGGLALGPVNAALDVVVPIDNDPSLRVGAEYQPVPELAVRLGYQTGPQDLGSLGLLSGMTAGLGVGDGPITVDYAITVYGKLGASHRISISYHGSAVTDTEGE